MINGDFNINKEWEFIYQESVNKAPTAPVSMPLVQARELLLKAQMLLGKYEIETDLKEQENIILEYNFVKNLYCNSVNGGMN